MTIREIDDYVEDYINFIMNKGIIEEEVLAILKDDKYFNSNFSFKCLEQEFLSEEEKRKLHKKLKKVFLEYIVDYANEVMDNTDAWDEEDKNLEPIKKDDMNCFWFLDPSVFQFDFYGNLQEIVDCLRPIIYDAYLKKFQEHMKKKYGITIE